MKAPPGSPAGRGFSFESSPGESFGARLRNSSRTPSSDSIFKQAWQFRCRTIIAMIPHTTSSSQRYAPEALMNLPPKRGRGERRVPAAPAASCALLVVERTRATTSTPERPAFPHAMVLTAYVGLSPVTGLFCHRHLADIVLSLPGWADRTPQNLTPASGRQDHTILPSAAIVSRQRAIDRSRGHKNPPCDPIARKTLPRPSHPSPTSVTIAIRPSCGVGCEEF
jgi:hypothetical protein